MKKKSFCFVLVSCCFIVSQLIFGGNSYADEMSFTSVTEKIKSLNGKVAIEPSEAPATRDGSEGLQLDDELDEPLVILALISDLFPTQMTEILLPFDDIGQIDYIDVSEGQPMPTLEEIQDYDVVWCYEDGPFTDLEAMGDLLADYVDACGEQWTPCFGHVLRLRLCVILCHRVDRRSRPWGIRSADDSAHRSRRRWRWRPFAGTGRCPSWDRGSMFTRT